MINLEKTTATASFLPITLGGGNPGTLKRANVKVILEGHGGNHVLAANNFHAMAANIAKKHGCTVQRCGYGANPTPYDHRMDHYGQWTTYARDGRETLHVVIHGNEAEKAAYELFRRFPLGLQSEVARAAMYARNMAAGRKLIEADRQYQNGQHMDY